MAKLRVNEVGLTPDIIRNRYAKGLGPTEIAREFGCSRQAVSDMAKKYGIEFDKVRNLVHDNFPWDVPGKYRTHAAYRNMWAYGRYFAGGWDSLTDAEQQRVIAFHNRMLPGDVVIEFNPNTGFEYVPRKESDGDLVFRQNLYSKDLTEVGEAIWVRPTVLPMG